MTQAQLEDPEGHRLVAAIHQRKADALGISTQGMWHDPNGIEYPYDVEDLRLLERARLAKRDLDISDGKVLRDE